MELKDFISIEYKEKARNKANVVMHNDINVLRGILASFPRNMYDSRLRFHSRFGTCYMLSMGYNQSPTVLGKYGSFAAHARSRSYMAPLRGQSMNSRRCNLRATGGKTIQPRRGLTVDRRGQVRPLQGRLGFSASASVGCTYGYWRCPASRDFRVVTERSVPTTQPRTQEHRAKSQVPPSRAILQVLQVAPLDGPAALNVYW